MANSCCRASAVKGIRFGRIIYTFGSRWDSWLDAFDMTAQLQGSLSRIGPKDWAIWELPDTDEPASTSEAELGVWIDRGKLIVKLKVEQDRRFPVFLDRLKSRFPGFSSYDQWGGH